MSKEDLIRKLTSRKFWVALIAFVSALLVAFHVSDNDIAQVSAIISAFGTLIIYIFTEGSVDKAIAQSNTISSITTNTVNKSTVNTTTKESSTDNVKKGDTK